MQLESKRIRLYQDEICVFVYDMYYLKADERIKLWGYQ